MNVCNVLILRNIVKVLSRFRLMFFFGQTLSSYRKAIDSEIVVYWKLQEYYIVANLLLGKIDRIGKLNFTLSGSNQQIR